MNIDQNENKCEPISILVSKHAYESFICKNYPKTCGRCPVGYRTKCNIPIDVKRDSTERPINCPLIVPNYLYDYVYRSKIVCLNEAELVSRNPILIPGAIIVAYDGLNENQYPNIKCTSCMKIGDGKSKFNDLQYHQLYIHSESDKNEDNISKEHIKMTKCTIELDTKEVVKLISICNLAISHEKIRKLNCDNNPTITKLCDDTIESIIEIKEKIKNAIIN